MPGPVVWAFNTPTAAHRIGLMPAASPGVGRRRFPLAETVQRGRHLPL